ncbi:hypothetical protein GCM10010095_71580 [Streptomyces anthocyanicus]|uniref:Secreted protein n=1 Tax=Streptomyces violaceolatus TaxID=67378 RepID=A0ABN3TH56_9ACTN|nr:MULTISPECIES: hypothetical protein [Streptomyces]MBQ0953808.1 hypothetical protein [Streptomyces sp. RK76]GGL76184.1 hypothetical protein GCM10010095_71580 [Streptomyces anthocyanicus]
MTTPPSHSPRLLLATLILTVAGAAMLTWPDQSGPRAAAPSRQAATFPKRDPSPSSSSAQPAARSTPKDAAASSPSRPALLPSASVSALPPHGEGTDGDRAIQQSLDTAWPADLDAVDERQLLPVGRALLRADATGVGRDRWPAYFGAAGQGVAPPAFATARFRIQAAVARQDGARDRAVVHLVWAGTDRGGTHTDGRITDLHFTRTTPTKEGEPAWIPQPRP